MDYSSSYDCSDKLSMDDSDEVCSIPGSFSPESNPDGVSGDQRYTHTHAHARAQAQAQAHAHAHAHKHRHKHRHCFVFFTNNNLSPRIKRFLNEEDLRQKK